MASVFLNPAESHVSGHLLDLLSARSRAVALILLDADGGIVRWLGGASEMFGYQESEVLGRRPDFLLPLRDHARRGGPGNCRTQMKSDGPGKGRECLVRLPLSPQTHLKNGIRTG